jgi:hypothetical protein
MDMKDATLNGRSFFAMLPPDLKKLSHQTGTFTLNGDSLKMNVGDISSTLTRIKN